MSGFSLLEALVATAIAAATLAAFFSAGSGAGALQIRAGRNAAASAIAFDLASSIGAGIPAIPGSRTGVAADGSEWRVDITPLASVQIAGRPVATPGLVIARLQVSGRGGEARLEIVRQQDR